MSTIQRSTRTNGKIHRGPVASTLAVVCMALPLSGLFGGTSFAEDKGSRADGTSTAGSTAVQPVGFVGPVVPAAKVHENRGQDKAPAPAAVTTTSTGTGANGDKVELVSDNKGSTFTGKGGGQPSGDIKSPQPFSNADNNTTGANDASVTNEYRSTRNGDPSLNGNGGGKQVGQPCAGCVGKADNKNPPGQFPNGSDHNAGYECDRNHGIGRSNPAHTACSSTTVTPPKDCKGVVGGHATAADCAPPTTPTTGSTGGGATGSNSGTVTPVTNPAPPVTRPVVGQGTTPVVLPIGGPRVRPAATRPTTLPFTGTDALLLAQLAGLMLLVGCGLVGMNRKSKAIRAL